MQTNLRTYGVRAQTHGVRAQTGPLPGDPAGRLRDDVNIPTRNVQRATLNAIPAPPGSDAPRNPPRAGSMLMTCTRPNAP